MIEFTPPIAFALRLCCLALTKQAVIEIHSFNSHGVHQVDAKSKVHGVDPHVAAGHEILETTPTDTQRLKAESTSSGKGTETVECRSATQIYAEKITFSLLPYASNCGLVIKPCYLPQAAARGEPYI